MSLLPNGLSYYIRIRHQEEVRLFVRCGGQVHSHIERQLCSDDDSIVEQEASPLLPMTYRAKLVRKAMRETKFDLESYYDSSWSSATNESNEREDEDCVPPLFDSTGENDSKSNVSANDEKSSNEEE